MRLIAVKEFQYTTSGLNVHKHPSTKQQQNYTASRDKRPVHNMLRHTSSHHAVARACCESAVVPPHALSRGTVQHQGAAPQTFATLPNVPTLPKLQRLSQTCQRVRALCLTLMRIEGMRQKSRRTGPWARCPPVVPPACPAISDYRSNTPLSGALPSCEGP